MRMDGRQLLSVAEKWGWVRIANETCCRNLTGLENRDRACSVWRLSVGCHLASWRDLHSAVK